MLWYHNGKLLNFLRHRPDFNIVLEPRLPLGDLPDYVDSSQRLGDDEKFTGKDSDVNHLSGGGEKLLRRHNDSWLSFNTSKNSSKVESAVDVASVSSLRIRAARGAHSGNYTCRASGSSAVSTRLYVTRGG